MTTIGLIIDRYHLEKKVSEFLRYAKKRAKINIYLEEEYILNFSDYSFNDDIFFVKAKGDLVVNLVKLIERDTNIPVVNPSRGIVLAFSRFLNSIILRKAGIRIPDFELLPLGVSPQFDEFITKNINDQKNYAFTPEIRNKEGKLNVFDRRSLKESNGINGKYTHLYYQKFVKSNWEYKVYIIGDQVFFYKQFPTLINPNKMESRLEIPEIKEIKEMAIKATESIGLKISSCDFLSSNDGEYYLTDINSSPNFNYIKNGHKRIFEYLLKEAKS